MPAISISAQEAPEYLSIRFDRDWLLVLVIGGGTADHTQHILVVSCGVFRLHTITRSAGTKEGLVGGTRQAGARVTRNGGQPEKGKGQAAAWTPPIQLRYPHRDRFAYLLVDDRPADGGDGNVEGLYRMIEE